MKYLSKPISIAIISLLGFGNFSTAQDTISDKEVPKVLVNTKQEPVKQGKFQPTWQSLKQYQTPEWFKDAKLGIWAHWGPQCQPECGDWYARSMYFEGSGNYKNHLQKYGHPSEFGFKDVIHAWKAQSWDPEKLVALYKRVGAQYFFAMANHHDNLDLWESKYQPWNTTKVGPQKDIIAGWAKAAKNQKLPFGLSVHASHAWSWYEGSCGADKNGDKAGVPYDGKLTKADGKGKWWDGLDPQELYAQNHNLSEGWEKENGIHRQWNWANGVSTPDQQYCDKFYNRTVDLINRFHPDLLYFDDTALPLWPVSDAGLQIAAHFYNSNLARNKGKLNAVLFGKILTDEQRKALVWDIERGVPNNILPYSWQTCSCIGNWHYDRKVYEKDRYKSAKTVIQMLADIVSKNGNLLLDIPVRGDGSIDEKEEKILTDIASWMDVNKECIFGTRPWTVFGEGPASDGTALSAQGFNEGKGKPFTAQDIRFTMKGKTLYAIILNYNHESLVTINALAKGNALLKGKQITAVKQLGKKSKPEWQQTEKGLELKPEGDGVIVFKIEGLL
jgi:alpha-L-fucosidase